MMQQKDPDDYVIATGEAHSVREFIEKAFAETDVKIVWKGSGADEVGIDSATGKTVVKIDSRYFRPTEVELLIGDPSKASAGLGWAPRVTFEELTKIMVKAD